MMKFCDGRRLFWKSAGMYFMLPEVKRGCVYKDSMNTGFSNMF